MINKFMRTKHSGIMDQVDNYKGDYWLEANDLLTTLVKNNGDKIVLDTPLKDKVLQLIRYSVVGNNYWLAKLIIYDEISVVSLVDFLFYVSLNREVSYKMFQTKPDDYGMTFMFNYHPSQLPHLKDILMIGEYDLFCDLIQGKILLDRLQNAKLSEIAKELPKSYMRFSRINPFVVDKT